MPNPNNRRQLAASMAGFNPQMNQLYAAYANKYHPGPDTPIDWNAFGMTPSVGQQPAPTLGMQGVPSASAEQGAPGTQGSSPVSDMLIRLLMAGTNPNDYGVNRKRPLPR